MLIVWTKKTCVKQIEKLKCPNCKVIANRYLNQTNDRSSKKSTMWLNFLSRKLELKIELSENSNEVEIGK